MPGKKKFTSKDYQSPLRKPGEKREDLPTQDGGKGTSSASNEAEKGVSPAPVPVARSEKDAEDPTSQLPVSQESKEKPADNVSQAPVPIDAEKDTEDPAIKLPIGQDSDEKPAGKADHEEKPLEEKKKEVLSQEADVSNTTKETTKSQEDSISSVRRVESDLKEPATTDQDETSLTEPTSKATTLSPFAKEFVPKASYDLASAVTAPEFVPASVPQQNERPLLLQKRSNTPENELMNCVKDVLFGLTQSPGELIYYFKTLVNELKKWLGTLTSLKEVVDLVFEYSITEPNFQYIAAKLCNLLSKEEAIILESGEKFRSVFMNRCRDEHLNRELSLKNPETLTRLLGFAMFEAELFCNYRMTGYLLDDPRFMDTDKERKEKVNKVFSDVEQLQKQSMLSESVKSLLSQVIKLRASSWNFSPTVGAAGTLYDYPGDNGYYFSDYGLGLDELSLDDELTPVTNPEQWSDYYDDGEDETVSSQDAYKYYFPENFEGDFSHEEEGGYYLEDDPEFDDEIDEEFEKFLQEQGAF